LRNKIPAARVSLHPALLNELQALENKKFATVESSIFEVKMKRVSAAFAMPRPHSERRHLTRNPLPSFPQHSLVETFNSFAQRK
jgi:hypothetical protein